MSDKLPSDNVISQVSQTFLELLSKIPSSGELEATNPDEQAKKTTTVAAGKAAVVSAGLSLPPGPVGMLTILPDLTAVWKIQNQMVADIAAVYGKTATLTQEQMLYCLFRHAAGQAVRSFVVRVGERVFVKRASLRVIQKALRKIGVNITQRIAGRTISRLLPVIGALGIGGYSFYDTTMVGKTARELFAEIEVENPPPRGRCLTDG